MEVNGGRRRLGCFRFRQHSNRTFTDRDASIDKPKGTSHKACLIRSKKGVDIRNFLWRPTTAKRRCREKSFLVVFINCTGFLVCPGSINRPRTYAIGAHAKLCLLDSNPGHESV